MKNLKVIYFKTDLSNPEEEEFILRCEGKHPVEIKLNRDMLMDYESVYNKIALREYHYFKHSLGRPGEFNLLITNNEYKMLFEQSREHDNFNEEDLEDIIKLHDELNRILFLLHTERVHEMSKVEFWKVENPNKADKMYDILMRDIERYKKSQS